MDSKSDFIRLCRLLLPMDPVLYEAEFVKLGEKLCNIPVQGSEGDKLTEAYFLLTRDVHLLKLPLGLAIDIYTALEKDNVLPPWPFYTTLLSRLKDVSYDVVKILYSAILKRCEGPPPDFALLSPAGPISKKALAGPFTAVIQAASLNRDLQTLDSAYGDLIRLQIPCDEIVYIVLFNHLRHLGDLKSIYQLYCYLKETKFPMTAKLFASALDGLGRSPEYHSRANLVYQDAKACGAHFSIECISVLAATKVRSGSYSQVVRMWSASEENILSHHLLSAHFVSLLLKSYAREARDPSCIIEIWRKIKLSCPEFRFTGGNYIVALSHLIRLHFRPSAGPDPSFRWPRGLVSSSPDAESHFLEVLSDLPSSLAHRETVLPHDIRHLRWFADTFPLVQKLLTDLDVKI
ncbi:hypothetical protein DSO57_1034367 [Entomophthora muscae]|uniref:Uncharacterized protein n=1 Tax=Entomophthora muscae TaxID=34485 RepID=A0ACC2U9D1_9FUNG|nr:hypothetical protein DSO57_1034367 [Entomophthora muscae]